MTTGPNYAPRMSGTRQPQLILCGGLQSSGSTLVSYCFLQRSDTNGVLDADNDLLPAIDERLARPIAWYKTTISCFRLSEIAEHYRDAGWRVRTLLILRDLRAVWSSLRTKSYGRNGITAEDPPLRLRVRRFIEDWRAMRVTGDAMLRYEDFVAAPRATLELACTELGLRWDESMLTWRKASEDIADHRNGNESFWVTRGADLSSSLMKFCPKREQPCLPAMDLEWLETEFRDFNEANAYPLALPQLSSDETTVHSAPDTLPPSFEVTRRYKWETAQKPFRWLLDQLGHRNATLIERRGWKRSA